MCSHKLHSFLIFLDPSSIILQAKEKVKTDSNTKLTKQVFTYVEFGSI